MIDLQRFIRNEGALNLFDRVQPTDLDVKISVGQCRDLVLELPPSTVVHKLDAVWMECITS